MIYLLKRAFAMALISFSAAFAVPTTWNIHPLDRTIIQIKDENMLVIAAQILEGPAFGLKMIKIDGITYNLPNFDQLYPANIVPSARKSNAIKIETVDLTSSNDGESILASKQAPLQMLGKRPLPTNWGEEIQQPHPASLNNTILPGPEVHPAPRPAPSVTTPLTIEDEASDPSLREEDLPSWSKKQNTAPIGEYLDAIVCWAIDPHNRGMLLLLNKEAEILYTRPVLRGKQYRRNLDLGSLRTTINRKMRKILRHPDDRKNLYNNGFIKNLTANVYRKGVAPLTVDENTPRPGAIPTSSSAPTPSIPDEASNPSLREEDLPNWERAKIPAPIGNHLNAVVCWTIDPHNRGMLLLLNKEAEILYTGSVIGQKGRRNLDTGSLRITLNGKYRNLLRHPDDRKNLYDNGFIKGLTASFYTKEVAPLTVDENTPRPRWVPTPRSAAEINLPSGAPRLTPSVVTPVTTAPFSFHSKIPSATPRLTPPLTIEDEASDPSLRKEDLPSWSKKQNTAPIGEYLDAIVCWAIDPHNRGWILFLNKQAHPVYTRPVLKGKKHRRMLSEGNLFIALNGKYQNLLRHPDDHKNLYDNGFIKGLTASFYTKEVAPLTVDENTPRPGAIPTSSSAPRPASTPSIPDETSNPDLREEDLPNWKKRKRIKSPTGDHLNTIICWAIDPHNRGMLLLLNKEAKILYTRPVIGKRGRKNIDQGGLRITLNGKYRNLLRHPDDRKNLYDNGFKENLMARVCSKVVAPLALDESTPRPGEVSAPNSVSEVGFPSAAPRFAPEITASFEIPTHLVIENYQATEEEISGNSEDGTEENDE